MALVLAAAIGPERELRQKDDLSAETLNGEKPPTAAVTMHVHGKSPVIELASALTDLDLVNAVVANDYRGADE